MKRVTKFLLPYLKQHWKKAIWAVSLSLPLAGIKAMQVRLVKHIVDTLIDGQNWQMGIYFGSALFLLGVINYPCRFYHFYYMRYVMDSAICQLRYDLFKKIQLLPLGYFINRKSGTLVAKLFEDTSVISQGFKSMIDFVREPITAIVLLGMAIYSDWQLSIVVLMVTPLFIIIFTRTGAAVRTNQNLVQEELSQLMHFAQEVFGGQKIIKSFNLQEYVSDRFNRLQSNYFGYQVQMSKVEENSHPMVELVGSFAFGFVVIFAYWRISRGMISTGDFFSFITALALVMDPLRKFSQANVRMNQAKASLMRLQQVLGEEEEVFIGKGSDDSEKMTNFNTSIEFKNLGFAYAPDSKVLEGVNLKIEKGERVAFVGPSGAGKSTLLNVLLRFFDDYSGQILLDGKEIRSFDLMKYRKIFGYVGQENFLFHESVSENLILGRDCSEQDLGSALDASFSKEFVDRLPSGVETILGDRGARISGGQCQRLSLARAILESPPILVFDEATSALDNKSEEKIKEFIKQCSKKQTVFCIAHRLNTIKDFDRIVVIVDGKKVEEGTHECLLRKKGEYYKLFNEGFSDFSIGKPETVNELR